MLRNGTSKFDASTKGPNSFSFWSMGINNWGKEMVQINIWYPQKSKSKHNKDLSFKIAKYWNRASKVIQNSTANCTYTRQHWCRKANLCDENHGISVRQISKTSGISHGSVYRILKKDLHFKPWKPIAVQEIFPEDEDRRLEFAETFLNLQNQMPNLFENIIWSDEAVFHLGGFVNWHN